MKFSISTSFYKRGHLVESVYQQVLDQTYTNWEWIVTDDFSKENSAREKLLKICAKDSRVKYYEQSRKKECFYNPQRGATGDIIVMFDSDDFAYPKVLEVYHHMFTKHPEITGISCYSHSINNANFRGICPYYEPNGLFNSNTLGETMMCRAFKNIFIDFDNGILKSHYNDLNIIRHIETIGKWLVIPRTLMNYDRTEFFANSTYNKNTQLYYYRNETKFSQEEHSFIENKFSYLYNSDKYSSFSYYFPILDVSRTLCFGEFNKSLGTKNILLINPAIKLYQKQLLKELYYDYNIYYDYTLNRKFDEIAVEINDITIELLFDIKQILSQSNPGTRIYFRDINYEFEFLFSKLIEIFGGVGYHTFFASPGHESFFITGV
jgi:glycosyltransferase involved in cell wall biosynthesis